MPATPKPVALIILDGWGYREDPTDNAIAAASTPVWDKLWSEQPHQLISASGLDVGLPAEQMGNSEVGHMVMGAGRVIYQSLTRISKAIEEGEFFRNPELTRAIDLATSRGKSIHVIGLLSPGGVHSHEDHIIAMLKMAVDQGADSVYMHAFLDGRDTAPQSAEASLQKVNDFCHHHAAVQFASLCGRYFAMDRDKRWDRVEKAYRMIAEGEADFRTDCALTALQMAYDRGERDEFVQPTILGSDHIRVEEGDVVICMNFRADRSREITQAFIDDSFDGFDRGPKIPLADYVMLTEYSAELKTSCAFPTLDLPNTLGQYLADLGKTQLRIAETEKYAHVTFFFSGGEETPYPGETRILIPSPNVATYDLQPEMSAPEVTDKLVEAIKSQAFDLIVCNYANGDMVGHTGNFPAAVKAVEALDDCLGRVVAALQSVGGECLITADHGNCEQMTDAISGQPHTAHTSELVPLVYVGARNCEFSQQPGGLADIAPSLLNLLGLTQPTEMTGQSLVKLND